VWRGQPRDLISARTHKCASCCSGQRSPTPCRPKNQRC
jgi:hypothetical protein